MKLRRSEDEEYIGTVAKHYPPLSSVLLPLEIESHQRHRASGFTSKFNDLLELSEHEPPRTESPSRYINPGSLLSPFLHSIIGRECTRCSGGMITRAGTTDENSFSRVLALLRQFDIEIRIFPIFFGIKFEIYKFEF